MADRTVNLVAGQEITINVALEEGADLRATTLHTFVLSVSEQSGRGLEIRPLGEQDGKILRLSPVRGGETDEEYAQTVSVQVEHLTPEEEEEA